MSRRKEPTGVTASRRRSAPLLASLMGLGTVVLVISASEAQGIVDNRCYLENGASADSYFVSEDLPVGSTIGQLRIHGDPRDVVGNVALRLKETDSPVRIAPGTRNLTLQRRLDKEGRDGPSSVYVNVICDRLHTDDLGFVIPIGIRVTDANDNAPRFVNAPYVLNISEVTVVGTRVLQGVRAVDDDQHGPFSTVRYSVLPGPHSDFFVFENELEGTLVLRRPLDHELLARFAVSIRAQDQGVPPLHADTLLHVNVMDADDQNPRFLDDRYTAALPEPPLQGAELRVRPRDIAAYDQDTGINAPIFYAFNSASNVERTPFSIHRDTGRVMLKRDVRDDELSQPITLVIRAIQEDNPDRYALATLTVSRATADSRDVRFLQRVHHVTAPENLPAGSLVSTLATNRPREPLKFYVSDQHLLELFSIDSAGELVLKKPLDYELRDTYVFKVFVTDGKTNDSSVVNISVSNVNDWEPRFRYPHYEFFVSPVAAAAAGGAEGQGRLVGRVEAADGDRGDVVHLSLTGPGASMFTVNELGEIRLKTTVTESHLRSVAGAPIKMTAVAVDSGRPPRQTSVPVTVHLPPPGPSSPASSHPSPSLIAGATGGPGGPLLLITVFGALLVLLALVIALLVLYICKGKRPNRNRNKVRCDSADSGAAVAGAGDGASGKMENPMFGDATGGVASAMGGVPSDAYTATVKSIMSRNGTVRTRIASPKVHPAPKPPGFDLMRQQQQVPTDSQNNLDEGGMGRGAPAWPASIPVRVKKLSWGDDSHTKTDTDSIENVNNIDTANLDPVQRIVDNSNLTVYF